MANFPVVLPNFRLALTCACFAALVPPARAGDLLAAGDIVVTGILAPPLGGTGVVRIDPATGAQTLLFMGQPNFNYIAVDRDERLYGTTGTNPGSARIVRIELATGTLGNLTMGMNLYEPQGVAVDEQGDLLVANKRMAFFPPSDATFLRIDAETGQQTVLAQNVFLARPKDLVLDVDGTAVVVDDTLYGAVFRADPITGAVTILSKNQNGLLFVATLVALAPGGMIFVNNDTMQGLVRVDPTTGAQFPSLQGLPTLASLKSSLDGDIFLATTPGALVLRFDPATETLAGTVTGGGFLTSILDMAVVPAPVTPPQVTCTVKSDLLWPPNHELYGIGLDVSVEHDAPTTLALAVYSDEDDLEPGSGNHAPDALDVAAGTLRLRAERSGLGDGRVYLIVATATDAFGNVGTRCCTVVVPKSQSAADEDEVRGQAAVAAGACNRTGLVPRPFVLVGER